MSDKQKFWGVVIILLLFLWVISPDDPSTQSTPFPEGTIRQDSPQALPRDTSPAAMSGRLTELPSPMYADQAMQQLIDSGAIHALRGVKLGSSQSKPKPVLTPPVNAGDATGTPATFRTQAIRFQTRHGILPLTAGIADTPDLHARGLMFYRQWPAQIHGVLFVGLQESIFNMWMKNTYLPLDMVFMNHQGKVVHIAENTATESKALISSQYPASMVLEIPAKAAKLWRIAVGDRLLLPLTAKTPATAH